MVGNWMTRAPRAAKRAALSLACSLVIGGAPVHQGGRGVGLQTGVDEVAGDIGQVFHAHDEDEGGSAAGQGLPVVHRTRFGGVFVPGDQGHG